MYVFPVPRFAFGGVGVHGPYTVSIASDGSVHATGAEGLIRSASHITLVQLAALDRRATLARFTSLPTLTRCPGATARSTTWIRIGSKKVTVVGTCLPAYQKLRSAFLTATNLFFG